MRASKITQLAKSVERKARNVHHRKRRGACFRHPSGQQGSATVWAIHYKMDHARMNKTSNDRDPPSGKRMMRIFDDYVEEVFLGSMSLARPASARAGWPRRSATRPVATIGRCSTTACPSSSKNLRWRAAMGVIPASFATWAAPICSSSTIGDWSRSTPPPGMISSKSSRSDTGDAQPSSPPNSPWTVGTRSSTIPLTPTPSWTASFTTPIGSN